MKTSVIMVDGGFREQVHGCRFFSEQDLPEDEFEVLWVEHSGDVNPAVLAFPRVRSLALGRTGPYHASRCFNAGIAAATGELLVIVDADQVVRPDFLRRVRAVHAAYDRLAVYGYRYDEDRPGSLDALDFDELDARCALLNPSNYGGCLTVRKRWLVAINGYDMHPVFRGGFHANGRDVYTRLRNLGVAVMWHPGVRLYHPWHPGSLVASQDYEPQRRVVAWRLATLGTGAFEGIDPARNVPPPPWLAELRSAETAGAGPAAP